MLLEEVYLVSEFCQIVYHHLFIFQLQNFQILLLEKGHFLADSTHALKESLLIGFAEGLFEEFGDVCVAGFEVERVLESECEVEQLFL